MRVLSIVLLPIFLLTGCAELSTPSVQTVRVMTQLNGQPVAGATCELKNNNGSWVVKTPGQLTIPGAFDELIVTCKKDGLSDGAARVESRYKGNVFRDVLGGRGVVALLDHTTGAAYEYPLELSILMGNTTQRIAAHAATASPNSSSTPATSVQSPVTMPATQGPALAPAPALLAPAPAPAPAPVTPSMPVAPVAPKMSLDDAVKKCAELGFIPGTELSGSCALKLSR